MRPRLRLGLTVCAVALHGAPAGALEPEQVRFTYDAAAGCPSEDEFLDAVARDGGVLARRGNELSARPARGFTVTLAPGVPAIGRLVVTEIDGRAAHRTIEGERCEDVARSLAVLVALSLEPGPDRPAPPPLPLPPPRGETLQPAEHPNDDLAPPVERWRVGVAAAGTLSSGVSPTVVPGIAAYAELVHDSTSVFAPALRIGYEATASGSATPPEAPGAPAVFSRRVGRADVCPLRFTSRQPWAKDVFSADLCARFDLGVLDVTGAQAPKPPSAEYLWVAAGALLRVRWVISPLFFDMDGGAMFPLARERFYFEPSSEVFQVPVVAGVTGFSLGGYSL